MGFGMLHRIADELAKSFMSMQTIYNQYFKPF